MRTKIIMVSLGLAAFAFCSCGGDSGKVADKGGIKDKKKTTPTEASTTPDTGGGQQDKGGTKPDQGGGPCTPFNSKANSGVLCGSACKTDAECKAVGTGTTCIDDSNGKACATGSAKCFCYCASADEICVTGFVNATKQEVGQCLGKCCADTSKPLTDKINLCQVPDPAKQFAACIWTFKDTEAYGSCGIYCQRKDEAGKVVTYPCPDPAKMDCVTDPAGQPDDKFCVPKGGTTPTPDKGVPKG